MPYDILTTQVNCNPAQKKTKCRKCLGRFLCSGVLSHERTGIIVFCVLRTFVSTVLFAQFPLCRMLVLVFRCITVCKNHHPPYVDSTALDEVHVSRCEILSDRMRGVHNFLLTKKHM